MLLLLHSRLLPPASLADCVLVCELPRVVLRLVLVSVDEDMVVDEV